MVETNTLDQSFVCHTIMPDGVESNCDLSNSDLTGSYLYKADLRGANLEHSDLADGYLSMADFTDANLRAANLTGSLLKDAIFCNTTMPDGLTNNSGCTR